MERKSWDHYFMDIAHVVATRSPCVRRVVGAVLVSSDHQVLATAYNGPPRGAPHRDEKTCVRIGIPSGTQADVVCCAHAESNAIAQAARHGVPVKGSTLYVTTSPCAWCARGIINAGVVRVVRDGDYADPIAAGVFAESNVPVEVVQRSGNLLVTLHHEPAEMGIPLKITGVTVEPVPLAEALATTYLEQFVAKVDLAAGGTGFSAPETVLARVAALIKKDDP